MLLTIIISSNNKTQMRTMPLEILDWLKIHKHLANVIAPLLPMQIKNVSLLDMIWSCEVHAHLSHMYTQIKVQLRYEVSIQLS